jgi:hypothetical protein
VSPSIHIQPLFPTFPLSYITFFCLKIHGFCGVPERAKNRNVRVGKEWIPDLLDTKIQFSFIFPIKHEIRVRELAFIGFKEKFREGEFNEV